LGAAIGCLLPHGTLSFETARTTLEGSCPLSPTGSAGVRTKGQHGSNFQRGARALLSVLTRLMQTHSD